MTIRHIFLALPLLAASAYAMQDGKPPQENPPRAKPEQKPEQKPAPKADEHATARGPALYMPTDVVGANVTNDKKERLGTIDDLVISTDGEISYAIVSSSDKLHAVPWSMFKVAPERVPDAKEGLLALPIGKDRLDAAPAIDKAKWTSMGDNKWLRETDAYFGGDDATAKRATDAAMSGESVIFKASNLKGMAVQTSSGESIGTVKEFVVDPSNGHVGYVAVDVGRYLGAGDKVVAMPWSTLKIVKPQDDKTMAKLSFDLGKERLMNAPEFKTGKESFKEMSDPAFLERVHQHYGARPYWKRADEAKDGSTPPAKKPRG
jgi:sporulation protein YlmC with PRC-barrel domain